MSYSVEGLDAQLAVSRRAGLRDFLRTRRARISPQEVGMPTVGRRNTPGLRREEVAVLAGVSASWYTWVEQGRDITVSTSVLDSVSRALRLDETERAHLYRLAGVNPPQSTRDITSEDVDALRRVVDCINGLAYVIDRYWNVLAETPVHAQCSGSLTSVRIIWLHASPTGRCKLPMRIGMPRPAQLVGQLRVQAGRYPDDPQLTELVEQLSSTDARFAQLWRQHHTRGVAVTRMELRHPSLSHKPVCFDQVILGIPDSQDLVLMLHIPHARPGAVVLGLTG